MAEPPPPARRYKTTLSCAECRRLKLRCDRVFPCSSCQRRGCASICPDGHMPPSKSVRKETPSQIEMLRSRVQELERELATLQKKSSSSPQSQRTDNENHEEFSHDDASHSQSEDTENLSESLGTLSITGYGKSRFFGITGSAAHWLWSIEEDDAGNGMSTDSSGLEDCRFPPEILFLISAFPSPIPSRASPEIWNWINANLPSHMEAWSLFETFYENGAYIFMSLPRTMFIEQIFSFFYGSNQGPIVDIPRSHRLALLLMVFAIGELLDLTKPAKPTGGKRFYFMARAALTLERLYEHPTLTAVQVIILMMMYLNMSDHKDSAELVWVLSGISLKLSLMLGLHRDSAKFNMDGTANIQQPLHVPSPAEAELRRVIFHEVVHFELWQALGFGRPSLLHFELYDYMPPGQGPERDNAHERSHVKGQGWSHGFIRECLNPVLEFTVGIKPPKYSEILKLDAKIRAHVIPQDLETGTYENESPDSLEAPSRAVTMLRFSVYSMKEVALLYLHRSCFASAMNEYPDPLSSPFGHSVLASYRSASTIVAKISMLYDKEPELSVRIYLFWGQLFVSCVLGALVVRCPSCSLAANALSELDAACAVFQKAQEGVRPAAVLPQVLHLRNKAQAAFQLHFSGLRATPEAIDVSAELSALGGSSRSRIIPSKTSSTSPADTTATQRSSRSPSAPPTPPRLDVSTQYIPHSAAPEIPVYTAPLDWPPLPDVDVQASFPLEPFPQGEFEFPTGDSDAAAFPLDILSDESHASFVQPGASMQEGYLGGLSPVDMEPTWQSFMAQMGFN